MQNKADTISPVSVSRALRGLDHVLVGGYALAVHTGKPPATMAVDMVVADVAKAELAIAKAFPSLVKMETPGEDVTRFRDMNGNEVINLLHPGAQFKKALTFSVMASVSGHPLRVASREAMSVAKFPSSKSR